MFKRTTALVIALVLSLSLFLYVDLRNRQSSLVFRKGVSIGKLKLAGKSWEAGYNKLQELLEKPLYISFENSSQAITLKDIGISLDRDRLARYTKLCKFEKPPLFCENTSNEPVIPENIVNLDQETLEKYLKTLDSEVAFLKQNTIISFEDYSFRTLSPSAEISINKTPFSSKEKIMELANTDPIKISLDVTTSDDYELQNQQTTALINKISFPLLIKYGRTPIYIPAERIKGFLTTEKRDAFLYGVISADQIKTYLAELKEAYGSEDVVVIEKEATEAIQRAMLYRAANENFTNAVVLPLEGKPKTNGELHDVYLEVVKSQQRLYRFENGNLTKTYIISTGWSSETPAGEFSVLNKQKMTISYVGNWYMPDYLPVGKIDGMYYFGFHAIPYHMDAAGNIYARDANTMGSPATGGCIQLKPEEATELFEWAEVGTPVYIYD